jgi:hypothetical protein
MGDKSPKSKDKNKKQADAQKQRDKTSAAQKRPTAADTAKKK